MSIQTNFRAQDMLGIKKPATKKAAPAPAPKPEPIVTETPVAATFEPTLTVETSAESNLNGE